MKPEITMCNYYGMCDEDGNPVGHAVKVTNEYSEILKEEYVVKLAASPCIAKKSNSLHFEEIKSLKYDICIAGNGIVKRIADKLKLIINIHQILKSKGVYFFYQVDFFFFFYMLFFYRIRKDRNIICLIYHQDFTGGKLSGILQWIYKSALKKIDGVIYTQIGNSILHKKAMWIPDFFYSNEQYEKYQRLEKKNRVVCVGTMNRYKQLETLVEVFAKIQMPLLVVGRFDSQERYKELIANKSENIEIENRNLAYDEYLTMIATSKYCILPYNMELYKNRTSGVLLESIYVGSIPIAPTELLRQNQLPGIEYDSLEDLFEKKQLLDDEVESFGFQKIYAMGDKRKFIEFMGDCK